MYDRQNNELDLIAKTIMRKDDSKLPNKVFAVEDVIDEDLRDWFKQKWVNIGAKKKVVVILNVELVARKKDMQSAYPSKVQG